MPAALPPQQAQQPAQLAAQQPAQLAAQQPAQLPAQQPAQLPAQQPAQQPAPASDPPPSGSSRQPAPGDANAARQKMSDATPPHPPAAESSNVGRWSHQASAANEQSSNAPLRTLTALTRTSSHLLAYIGVGSTPYQRLVHALQNDQKILNEISLGKRVGFYRFHGDLGSGNFSQVKMAVHHLCKERVAVKILDKSKLDQKTRRMLTREIVTMEAIHHPHIIRLYEVLETYSRIHLVLEYASGGELFNRITSCGRLLESDAAVLFAQIVSAVKYMHGKNFIHRDIKAENVFFAAPSLVKLGDFGFSTELNTGHNQHLTTFCGSPPYAAPELFHDESYLGAPVDIWALGVLLYFMVTGQMPFKAQTVATLKKHIIDGNYSVPSHVSSECKNVIEGILKQVPQERLSITEIEESEWLKNVPFPPAPGPTEKYSLLPTVLPQEKVNTSANQRVCESEALNVSDIEWQAHEHLSELGITEAMLAEHLERGAKSAVIGTYRIIVHRLQRQANLASEVNSMAQAAMDSASCSGAIHSANSSGHSFPLSLRRRSKSAAVKSTFMKSHKNRSRTCILL